MDNVNIARPDYDLNILQIPELIGKHPGVISLVTANQILYSLLSPRVPNQALYSLGLASEQR